MTNEAKYKTVDERVRAFDEWCKRTTSTKPCMYVKTQKCMNCFAHWLALEAEEEKPEPCPFCGSKMGEGQSSDLRRVLICENEICGYITPKMNTTAEAIAAHNRVARAVRGVKLAHETMNKIENSTIGFCNYEKETITSILKRYREASYVVGAAKESEVK